MKRWGWWIIGVALGIVIALVLARLRSDGRSPGRAVPAPADTARMSGRMHVASAQCGLRPASPAAEQHEA